MPSERLAETVGIPTVAAAEYLERWHGVHRDVEDRNVAFGGLSIFTGFCRFVQFLASPEAAEAWTARHPGSFVISIAEGFEIGRLTNAARFGQALAR